MVDLKDIVARNRAGEICAIPSVCSAHPDVLRASLMLADEFPQMDALSPHSRGGATASFMIYVPDADAAHAQAIQAGASENSPVKLEFWGDRIGTVVDPFGHKWSLATHVEDVSPEEMERRMQEWSSSQG